MFGGHKTVIGTVLWPTVIFTGGLLALSTGWAKWDAIYIYNDIVSRDSMYKFIRQRAVGFWSIWFEYAVFCPSTWRRPLALSKLVKIRSLWPTFDLSLVVLLVGQNFGWTDLLWPIRFQYSSCALVKYCKHSFKLLSRLMLVWILHTNKICI